jgi:hypothetical protein
MIGMMMRQRPNHSIMAVIAIAGGLTWFALAILIHLYGDVALVVFAGLVLGTVAVLTVLAMLYSIMRAVRILAGGSAPPLLRRSLWIVLLVFGSIIVAPWLVLLHERRYPLG